MMISSELSNGGGRCSEPLEVVITVKKQKPMSVGCQVIFDIWIVRQRRSGNKEGRGFVSFALMKQQTGERKTSHISYDEGRSFISSSLSDTRLFRYASGRIYQV